MLRSFWYSFVPFFFAANALFARPCFELASDRSATSFQDQIDQLNSTSAENQEQAFRSLAKALDESISPELQDLLLTSLKGNFASYLDRVAVKEHKARDKNADALQMLYSYMQGLVLRMQLLMDESQGTPPFLTVASLIAARLDELPELEKNWPRKLGRSSWNQLQPAEKRLEIAGARTLVLELLLRRFLFPTKFSLKVSFDKLVRSSIEVESDPIEENELQERIQTVFLFLNQAVYKGDWGLPFSYAKKDFLDPESEVGVLLSVHEIISFYLEPYGPRATYADNLSYHQHLYKLFHILPPYHFLANEFTNINLPLTDQQRFEMTQFLRLPHGTPQAMAIALTLRIRHPEAVFHISTFQGTRSSWLRELRQQGWSKLIPTKYRDNKDRTKPFFPLLKIPIFDLANYQSYANSKMEPRENNFANAIELFNLQTFTDSFGFFDYLQKEFPDVGLSAPLLFFSYYQHSSSPEVRAKVPLGIKKLLENAKYRKLLAESNANAKAIFAEVLPGILSFGLRNKGDLEVIPHYQNLIADPYFIRLLQNYPTAVATPSKTTRLNVWNSAKKGTYLVLMYFAKPDAYILQDLRSKTPQTLWVSKKDLGNFTIQE